MSTLALLLAGGLAGVGAFSVLRAGAGTGRSRSGHAGAGRAGPLTVQAVPNGAMPWWAQGRRARTAEGAHWATPREVALLRTSTSTGHRLVVGTAIGHPSRRRRPRTPAGGRASLGRLLAVEAGQSLAVVGPTQSGKTTALVVPAILGWEGPVLAASVKSDLLATTLAWRRTCGPTWVLDPTGSAGAPALPWSPLRTSRTWAGARRTAAALVEAAQGEATTADGEFWYAMAAKALAPLLLAASLSGRSMVDVVRWVDVQEVAEVSEVLERARMDEALQAARAGWLRDERQRSSVYTTAESVLEPFASALHASALPGGSGTYHSHAVPDSCDGQLDPDRLLDQQGTVYVCAPGHDQRRLRGLFTAAVSDVVDTAYTRATHRGAPLSPPLLVVLDEAANIAPLGELDGLAATCAGHGVQLVTVWQDLAQISARYGPRAATVVNNHRGKLFLPGIADPGTLEHASALVGQEEVVSPSLTVQADGSRSVTSAPLRQPLLAPDALRAIPRGTGVLVYGALPPVRVGLRAWWEDPGLRARGQLGAAPRAHPPVASRQTLRGG